MLVKLPRSQYLIDMSSEQESSPELSVRYRVLYTGPRCPRRIFIFVPVLSSSFSSSSRASQLAGFGMCLHGGPLTSVFWTAGSKASSQQFAVRGDLCSIQQLLGVREGIEADGGEGGRPILDPLDTLLQDFEGSLIWLGTSDGCRLLLWPQ